VPIVQGAETGERVFTRALIINNNAMEEEKAEKKDVMDIDPREYEGDLEEVFYSYRTEEKTMVPSEVLDTEDDGVIAEWIAKWESDVVDIQIVSY
jgi:L-rhamnose isomerase